MTDNFEIVYDEETGCWTKMEKSYMTIEIPTKGDYESLMEKIDFYDKNHDRIEQVKKTAVKEFAEKVKDYLEYKLVDEFGDMAVDVQYLTIDIDEFEDYVDELLREYEK